MSLFLTKLQGLLSQEIVVVMSDNRAFRGKLIEVDAETIVLRDVVEALPSNAHGWEEPTATTAIVHKVVTWKGTFSHEETDAEVVRLQNVMIRVAGVLRVWEWSLANAIKPEHVEMADEVTPRPGTRITKRG